MVVERLAVGRLALAPAVLGKSAVFTLEGRIMAVDPVAGRVSSLHLKRTDGVRGEAVVTAVLKGDPPALVLHAQTREAAGGLVATALGPMAAGPLVFSMHGEAPLTAWKGNVSASIGQVGDVEAEIGVWAPKDQDDLRLTVEGTIELASAFLPVRLAPLLGGGNHFAVAARLTQAETLAVDRLTLKTEAATLQVAGLFDLKTQRSQGAFSLRCDDLSPLRSLAGSELKGGLTVEGKFSGALYQPHLALSMKISALEIMKFRAGRIEGNLDVACLGPLASPFLGLRITGNGMAEALAYQDLEFLPEDRLTWSVAAEGPVNEVISISDLRLEAPAVNLTAETSLDLSNNALSGCWQLTLPQLHTLSQTLKHRLGGSLQVEGEIGGSLKMAKLTMKARGNDILIGGVRFQQIGLTLLAEGMPARTHGNLRLDLQQAEHRLHGMTDFILERRNLILSLVSVQAAGSEVRGKLVLDLDRLLAEGNLEGRCKDLSSFSVLLGRKLSGDVGLKMRLEPSGVGQNVDFQLVGTDLATSFGYASKVRLDACLTDAFKSLRGTAEIEIKAFQDDELTLATVVLSAAGDSEHITFTGRAEGRYKAAFEIETQGMLGVSGEGRLHAKVTLEGLAEKPMEARLDLPVALSLAPFGFSLPPKGVVKGHLVGEANLIWLSTLFSLDDQSLDGRLEVTCALKGTVAAPDVTGRAHLREGVYANFRTGTTLKNVDVKLAIKGSRLVIEQVQGTDGEDGVLSLHGRLDFSPDKDFPFQLDLILENATLLRLDEATATAGGRLTFSGLLREALVAGKLDVGPVEIRIPDRLPPEMTELEIIEIGRGSQKSRQEPSPQPTLAPRLLFDVSLESPGRVFVRGRGLDSEWGGAIRITGSAHEPLITGHLSIVRGHFNFLDKRFLLTEGSLSFGGTVPPAPVLDVTAEAEAGDMTALLRLSGPVSAPEVSLTSNPALPSDEVLCRLLFGRSVADITPMQAVRLAYAATTLAGSGGSWDLMGGARNLLGVDQLEIKQSGEESARFPSEPANTWARVCTLRWSGGWVPGVPGAGWKWRSPLVLLWKRR